MRGVDVACLAPRPAQNYFIVLLNAAADAADVAAFREHQAALRKIIPNVPPFLALIAQYTTAQLATHLDLNEIVDEALREADAIETHAEFGSVSAFAAAVRARYALQRGRVRDSVRLLARVSRQPEVTVARNIAAFVAGYVAEACGDEEPAVRALAEAGNYARDCDVPADSAAALGARAAWLASRGRLREAQAHLALVLSVLGSVPPSCGPFLVTAARYAQPDLLDRIVELADPAERSPQDRAGRAYGELVLALVARRRGRLEAAMRHANAAADGFAALEWPLYRARALEAGGDAETAREIYQACGATAELPRVSLHRSESASARTAPLLSAREREIAEFVTVGLSNPAIAERLAVSVKTVEKHVSSVFEKFGVRSRAQIAAAMRWAR